MSETPEAITNAERREQLAIDQLRPRLTEEFLDTLLEAAKVCGWGGADAIEVGAFLSWCRMTAGKPDIEYGVDWDVYKFWEEPTISHPQQRTP